MPVRPARRHHSSWTPTAVLRDSFAALVDLVLPAPCAGCATDGVAGPLCTECVAALASVQPQRVWAGPVTSGLPRTYALAAYGGALRSALLHYKERGRHALAAPLGDHLATVVVRGLGGSRGALRGPRGNVERSG